MIHTEIYSYITAEESAFQTEEVQVGDNWHWNFRNHVQLLFHLKNGVFYTGANDWLRAFKNIMEPILHLSYWTEDIEVKDIVFFIENQTGRALSFLIKKYHDEVYVREHNLDTVIDQITESDLDYGGVLVQKGKTPEVMKLNAIAFCDQTDIMGGPIGFKMSFSPTKLRQMEKMGWGKESNGATISINELITLAEHAKDPQGMMDVKKNRTTGKNIDVYIVRGPLPEHYLEDNNDMEYYCPQLQIVAFYTDSKEKRQGVTLYRKKANEGDLKFFTSQEVYGRGLGRGVGEALLHPQIWTNFLTIHKTKMLEAGSKTPLQTDDPAYANRNKVQDMDNLEVTVLAEGKRIDLIPTVNPTNVKLFEGSINEWYEHAQFAGSSFDSIMGKQESAGTTFKGQERLVMQGQGMHDRRRGQRAKFIEEIYRDWIIPDMVKGILNGTEFLANLSAEEMNWVSDQLAENHATRTHNEMVINGELPPDGMTFEEHKEMLRRDFLQSFSKKGNKHLIKILEGEFRDIEVKMGINIAGKQKDLAGLSDKVLAIFQFVLANPQQFQMAMKIPGMAKAFQDIMEYSGMTNVDFSSFISVAELQPPVDPTQMQQPAPLALNQPTA